MLWDWLAAQIADAEDGANNRFDVAEAMNAAFDGPGPFWGKTHRDRWPGIPYRKEGIAFRAVPETRACDRAAATSSSCFQLCYNPTVGSQALMGLPMLSRLRRMDGVAVWPFEDWQDAAIVLAEIWPGVIEPAVKEAMARDAGAIRDREQVRLLARALSRLPEEELAGMMSEPPPEAREEAWVLGAGHAARLCALASEEPRLAPPPLRDDCFALPAGVDWTPVDQALAMLRDRLHPVVGRRTVPLSVALGHVLAGPVVARRSNPPHPNSAVDGYGFAACRPWAPAMQVLPLLSGRAAAGAPFRRRGAAGTRPARPDWRGAAGRRRYGRPAGGCDTRHRQDRLPRWHPAGREHPRGRRGCRRAARRGFCTPAAPSPRPIWRWPRPWAWPNCPCTSLCASRSYPPATN